MTTINIQQPYGQKNEPVGIEAAGDTTSLGYDAGNRRLTITPIGMMCIWVNGIKYEITQAYSAVHPDTTGIHFFYFNSTGQFVTSTTVWDFATEAPVAIVYWNSALQKGLVGDERHGVVMDWATHQRLHNIEGAQLASGGALSGYTLNTSTDDATTFAIDSGILFDEDIRLQLPAIAKGGPYAVAYRTGAGTAWAWTLAASVPRAVGTYVQYNRFNVDTWVLADLTNNQWVNYYIIATDFITSPAQWLIIPGQTTYTSLSSAQAETIANLDLTGLPTAEFSPVWKITYRASSSYTTVTGRVRIESVTRLIGNRISATVNAALPSASAVVTDVANFDGILSAADNSVQKALDTLDSKLSGINSANNNIEVSGSAQNIALYGTAGTNYERILLGWQNDNGFLGPQSGGTGALKPLWIRQVGQTVASLPPASSDNQFVTTIVTDASSRETGTQVIGGGTFIVRVMSTGTIWQIG